MNSEQKGRKGLSCRISGGGRVVPVELDEVVEGDEDTHQVHQDPEEVQDVVPIRALQQVKNFEDIEAWSNQWLERIPTWTSGQEGSLGRWLTFAAIVPVKMG